MSAGTSQQERFPPALAAGYFQADALSFEQRVAMTAALAAQLRFVDLNLLKESDWGGLFTGDVTLVLARIAAIDQRALRDAFLRDADSGALPSLALQVVQLAQWIDLWFKSLDGLDDAAALAFRGRIRQLVDQQLAEDLRWVYRHFGAHEAPHAQAGSSRIDATQDRLDAMWGRDRPVLRASASQGSERELLRERYFAFLSAIDTLQALARELLPGSLQAGTHAPAAGLVIAFLKLWEPVQQEFNRFAARHVDFYYRDCLGLGVAGPQADEVHLACARDARAGRVLSVPQGTLFEGGKDADGQPQHFHSAAPLVVTDAVVAQLCTLRLERDALVSPEREFGFVTRAKSARLAPVGQGPSPLFGGGRGPGAQDARLGLAIASSLLLLREGDREIEVELPARAGAADDAADAGALEALVAQAEATALAPALHAALGRLFGHWLLASQADLAPGQLQRLRAAAVRVLQGDVPQPTGDGDPLSLLAGSRPPARQRVFDRLFQGLLKLRLTAANGWLEASDARVTRAATGGLLITLRLRPEVPAIVGCDPLLHGADWGTRLPLLRIELGTQGRLYACSLLADLPLTEARLRVAADGVRALVLHNNLGALDPTKAFAPFGPLPTLSSYLEFGAAELACKNLQRLSLQIEWGGLPPDAGGFQTHYRGYPEEQRCGDFRATLAMLSDGVWQPCSGASAQQALFAGLDDGGYLRPRMDIEIDPASVRKHGRAGDPAQWGAVWPRHGLYRLQLQGPRGAFGHTAYPLVLADTVTANARARRLKRLQPLPNPPYTPLIERLALRYEAAGVISIDAGNHLARHDADGPADVQHREHLLHLHPFGIERLHSAAAGQQHGLLPQLGDDGNLYIGLSASEPAGTLTLLFQLCESAAEATSSSTLRSPVRWATLADDHWRPLEPERVLSDSTDGFLSSGIVTLDLPHGMTCDNDVMPAGLYWLRVSASGPLDAFASLQAVQAHALRARRVLAPGAAALAIVPQGRITKPAASVPGLAGVQQVGPSFGLRAPEDPQGLITRAGERLRHKQRASVAWDAERLLLHRFPEVFKARCLSGDEIAASGLPRPPAGQVLVVVVPQVPRNDSAFATEAPRFNAVQLARMCEYLRERASPFAQIVVRNPVYDRIQLRCSVGLERGAHEGEVLQRLNAAVVRLLSPWCDEGCGPDFDWVVRSEDLQAQLRQLQGVDYVTRLSLLHVACSDAGAYTLGDTARRGAGEERVRIAEGRRGHAVAHVPWSLALPMPTHLVTALSSVPDATPVPTGIAKLAIGSTFVIGRAQAGVAAHRAGGGA